MAEAAYINTGAHDGKPLTLRFADGEHTVPGWVVARVGAHELESDPAGLALVRFEDFMKAFVDEMSSAHLRQIGATLLAQHFGRFRL